MRLCVYLAVFVAFLINPFNIDKAAAACGTYYIDSNDPNWSDSYDGGALGWSYNNNASASFRGDHFIASNSSQSTERWFEWGSYSENSRICGTTASLSVYLNSLSFVDPDAEYYASTGAYTAKKVATINQELAAGGWNSAAYLGTGFAPLSIMVASSGKNGATGADGVRLVAN